MMEAEFSNNLSLVVFIATGGILVLIISIVIISLISQKRVMNSRLSMEKLKTQHQKKLTEVSFLGQENERKRIAKDIHDDIGSLLSAVKQQVNLLGLKTKQSKELSAIINETRDTLGLTITEIRNIIEDLSPAILESKGLTGAIQYIVEKFNNLPDFSINYKVKVNPVKLEKVREIMIYRSFQEILNNTIKHSKATQLDIIIDWQEAQLLIEIKDNGIGFDYEQTLNSEHTGFGLKNIASRIELARGKLKVTSSPKGTSYQIICPYVTEPEISKT